MTFQLLVYCICLGWVMGQYPDHFVYVHRNTIMQPFNPTCLSIPRLCICIKGMRTATQRSSRHVRSVRHAGTMGNLSPLLRHIRGTPPTIICLAHVPQNSPDSESSNPNTVPRNASLNPFAFRADLCNLVKEKLNHNLSKHQHQCVGPSFAAFLKDSIIDSQVSLLPALAC